MICDKCKHADGCPAKAEHGGALRCSAYKPQEQTNEEWLRSCTTEQLADAFYDFRYINATKQQQLWMSANEEFVKNGIVEWLKQPHK